MGHLEGGSQGRPGDLMDDVWVSLDGLEPPHGRAWHNETHSKGVCFPCVSCFGLSSSIVQLSFVFVLELQKVVWFLRRFWGSPWASWGVLGGPWGVSRRSSDTSDDHRVAMGTSLGFPGGGLGGVMGALSTSLRSPEPSQDVSGASLTALKPKSKAGFPKTSCFG